jgi:hypothetical protein
MASSSKKVRFDRVAGHVKEETSEAYTFSGNYSPMLIPEETQPKEDDLITQCGSPPPPLYELDAYWVSQVLQDECAQDVPLGLFEVEPVKKRFDITAFEDAELDRAESGRVTLWNSTKTHIRFLRLSATTLNGRPWISLKCFKFRDNDALWRKTAQIYMNSFEFSNLMRLLSNYVHQMVMDCIGLQVYEKMVFPTMKYKISPEEDTACCHWSKDLVKGKYRMIRLAFVVFRPDCPWESTYVYIKVFKVGNDGVTWQKHNQIALTVEEFNQLVISRPIINSAIREIYPTE